MVAQRSCVLIPLKAFTAAKARLSGALDPAERATLARSMAERVVRAAEPLPVWVVCEDDEVAAWARDHGAHVEWTPGLGLDGALQAALARRADDGFTRAVIAHGDLPFAAALSRLADEPHDTVCIVADRRGTGTNVLSVPTDRGFRFAYGDDSFGRHVAETERRGLVLHVEDDDALAWDVDEPDDLDPPPGLGELLQSTQFAVTTSPRNDP